MTEARYIDSFFNKTSRCDLAQRHGSDDDVRQINRN